MKVNINEETITLVFGSEGDAVSYIMQEHQLNQAIKEYYEKKEVAISIPIQV